MPNKKSKDINLIPQNEFETSNFGRILKWALSTFRVIVIITELIVMSAFLSRFWLDAKNSDLTDELNTTKRQVEAFSDIENEFRILQKKVNIAKVIYNQKETNKIISNLLKYLPENVFLSTLSINDNHIAIKAFSTTEQSIAQLMTNLENYKEIDEIILSQISTDTSNANLINFNISAIIK